MTFLTTRNVLAAAFATALSLASLPAFAQTSTVYDATGGAEGGGDNLRSGGFQLFDRFYNPTAGTLSSVTLNLMAAKQGVGQFNIAIATENAKTLKPGKPVPFANLKDADLTTSFALTTVTPATPITLAANTYYYIGVLMVPHGKSSVVLGNTLDPSVLARPDVQAGAYYWNSKGGLQANAGGPYEISINVAP